MGTSSSRTEYENAGRSRSQQNFKNAPHERRTLSSNSSLVDDSLSATGHLVPFKSRTLSSQQLSDIENILERTKTEIHQKLTDVDASAIKVQLEGTKSNQTKLHSILLLSIDFNINHFKIRIKYIYFFNQNILIGIIPQIFLNLTLFHICPKIDDTYI